jgi:hypothetical protein
MRRGIAVVRLIVLAGLAPLSIGCSPIPERSAPHDSLNHPTSTPLTIVDKPPENVPNITLNGVEGVVIYTDWTSNGRSAHVRPGSIVSWSTTVSPSNNLMIDVGTKSRPIKTSVRVFGQPVPLSGTPDSTPDVYECGEASTPPSTPAAGPSCRVTPNKASLEVSFTGYPRKIFAIIANLSWYVPMSERQGIQNASPLDTVAVGWRL